MTLWEGSPASLSPCSGPCSPLHGAQLRWEVGPQALLCQDTGSVELRLPKKPIDLVLQTGEPFAGVLPAATQNPSADPYLLALLGEMRDPPLLPREQSGQTQLFLVLHLLFFGGLEYMFITQ